MESYIELTLICFCRDCKDVSNFLFNCELHERMAFLQTRKEKFVHNFSNVCLPIGLTGVVKILWQSYIIIFTSTMKFGRFASFLT